MKGRYIKYDNKGGMGLMVNSSPDRTEHGTDRAHRFDLMLGEEARSSAGLANIN